MCLGVESLGHSVGNSVFNFSEEAPYGFSRQVLHLHSTCNASSLTLAVFCFLIAVVLMGARGQLMVVLTGSEETPRSGNRHY